MSSYKPGIVKINRSPIFDFPEKSLITKTRIITQKKSQKSRFLITLKNRGYENHENFRERAGKDHMITI